MFDQTQQGVRFCFGNDSLDRESLIEQFPNPRFLHQVHGSNIIESVSREVSADGHYSLKRNESLVIKTADCLPVLLFDDKIIMAIHAGWRGVAQKIFTKGIQKFPAPERVKVFVGPHIKAPSFELDTHSTQTLLSPRQLGVESALSLGLISISANQTNHYCVSLESLILKEAMDSGILKKNIWISSINTFTSPEYFSHRRNRHRIGQNYSIISRI